MKILMTVDSLCSDQGGPSRSVPGLCRALADLGVSLELWTLQAREVEGVTVRGFKSTMEMIRALRRMDVETTFLHDNGLWRPFNFLTCFAAVQCGMRYAVSIRGMLEPWSLTQSPWKKRLALIAYQRFLLNRATFVHATGFPEAQSIRAMRIKAPIVVQPNGIDIRPDRSMPSVPFQSVLYLSRIHEKKGLEMLFDAWAATGTRGWKLRIAGRGQEKYLASLKARIVDLGIGDQIEWIGEKNDTEKWTYYESSDLFILPSFSENFGIVVAEALSAGVPVITTTGTPWSELEKHGCGLCVPPETHCVVTALKYMLGLSHEDRVQMGLRGKKWMEQDFSWNSIAKGMSASYDMAMKGIAIKSNF